jgi:hypothetical protein
MNRFFDTPLKQDLFFIALLISCFFLFQYERLLPLGPDGLHVWRQSDCLSLAQNYYNGRADGFFEPEIHHLISDNSSTGKAAGEFPVMYYMIAQLWALIGKSHWSWRLVAVLLTFTGIFALYRSFRLLGANLLWSVVWPLMILSCPVVAEYGSSFLTDIPGLSLAFVAWYFFIRFSRSDKDMDLLLSMLFFCMAGLLKISALILGVASLSLFMFELIGWHMGRDGSRLFRRPLKQAAIIVLSLSAIPAWFAYVSHYTDLHQGKYTFNDVWPVWQLSPEQIAGYLDRFWEGISMHVMAIPLWFVLALIIAAWPFVLRRCERLLTVTTSLVLLGTLLYLGMWFQSIDAHDYYFANAMAAVALAPLPLICTRSYSTPWLRNSLGVAGVLLLCFNVVYTRLNLELRHFPVSDRAYSLMPERTVGIVKWLKWDIGARTGQLNKMEDVLQKAGVTFDSKVVVFPDITINHTLYLLDRQGWTDYSKADRYLAMKLANARGADFLFVLNREEVYGSAGMEVYRDFVTMRHHNIDIIDLNAYRRARGLPE